MSLCAIIPVKPLRRGKSRLSSILSVEDRTNLNKQMLINMLNCVKNVPQIDSYIVISYDPTTLALAREFGAKTVQESRITNLNRALRKATAAAKAFNATMVLILPADLPLLKKEDIRSFIKHSGEPPEIVISSDHRQNGTNALLVNPIGAIDYDFGAWSFKKHIEQAERKKLRIDICNIESFKYDLDIPEDLELVKSKGMILIINYKEIKMSDRVALYLQDSHDLRQGLDYVKYAEQRGFEAVWQAESRLVRDAIVPMAAYAAVTSKLKVGSGVINNWTRNIGLLAATFLTLDDLAPNRIICGIGAWWDPLAKNVGIDRKKPLIAMRETVEILRKLLHMERVTFHGEFIHVDGIELDVVHGRREPRHVPIYIGATGDKMMEMTGEIADGVVLNYCVPPEYNINALNLLEIGAKRGGRKMEDIDRPQLVVCSVDLDHDKAIDTSRELLTQYLAQQPHIAKASGVSQDVVDKIQSILGWPATYEQIQKAKHLGSGRINLENHCFWHT